jgi:hypothetical protein
MAYQLTRIKNRDFHRTDLLEQRRPTMAAWDDFVGAVCQPHATECAPGPGPQGYFNGIG